MAWIEKRGNKYRVYWDVGTPDNRKRRVESFDTSKEAEQFKKKIEYEASIGLCIDISRMTVAEYLDYWLKFHKKNLEPKTLASYNCEIKNHIKPHLGNLKLIKLAPLHLENYYYFLLEEGKVNLIERQDSTGRMKDRIEKMRKEGKAGLSVTTVRYHHRIIHKALNQALKWQMVPRNAADAVEPPKIVKKEIEHMKKDQVNKFIECIKGSSDYPVIAAAIFTGMRQGELLGLKWENVDFDAGIIHVKEQLQYLPDRGYFFKPPKQHSVRDIPMPLPLGYILRQVKKEQERLKEIYKTDYQNDDLVFCNLDGQPMDGTGLTKRFQKLLKDNGFPKIRFHALRHTFATMCRAAGMEIADIQDLLGHADISTTKNMYTHIEIDTLKKAMDKFTQYLGS
jgi:integrase